MRGAVGRPRKEKTRDLPPLTRMQRVYIRELQAKHGDDYEVRAFSHRASCLQRGPDWSGRLMAGATAVGKRRPFKVKLVFWLFALK